MPGSGWYYPHQQEDPQSVPPSLFSLSLRAIHDHFSSLALTTTTSSSITSSPSTITSSPETSTTPIATPISTISTPVSTETSSTSNSSSPPSPLVGLPSGLIQTVLTHMMFARRMGSRSLNELTVHWFFVPSLLSLDLEGFWVDHLPFVHYDCPYLHVLNLYVHYIYYHCGFNFGFSKNCLPMKDAAIQRISVISPHIKVL